MKNNNGFKIGLCMLTFGITLGYFLAKLMDKLDWQVFCVSSGSKKPDFFRDCCQNDPASADCGEDANEPEPYTEPLQESAMEYDGP